MFRLLLASGVALSGLFPAVACAQDAVEEDSVATMATVTVTARQREESLKDVPIAVTALSGDDLKDQQVMQVKDIAAYSPGLNINSDSAGRAFVSMRGIGTTLIDSVQPGVGIFIDGIYQPNTSYLNSPLVDVERVEVLRGPQGTLFGNNTLGGAINVISKQPSDEFEGQIRGAYAGPDNFQSASARVSGPIIKDVLQFRLGGAYHSQDNFQENSLIGGLRNPLEQKSISGGLRFVPTNWATLNLNANFDEVFGGSVPYAWVTSPTDYTLDAPTNLASYVTIEYTGVNLKGEFDVDAINTEITTILAYNKSDADQPFGDGDFGPIDFLRGAINRQLETETAEIRFDTQWSDSVSTLIGIFSSQANSEYVGANTIVPLGLTVPSVGGAENKTQSIFGTLFWQLDPTLDLAIGLRYDHQELDATSAATADVYEADEVQPRVTLTKKWSPEIMTYASVARGFRGGGQNDPGSPNLIYEGDSVWTYELGTKLLLLDNKLSLDSAIFYNDYRDFIGPNALAPSTTGVGFVAVNLNAGDVESYGFEAEAIYQLTDSWNVRGNIALLHARVTDSSQFFDVTGYNYPGDRILFVPDWTFNVGTSYRWDVGPSDDIVFDANLQGKGERTGGSLDEASIPEMPAYYIMNASVAWQHDNVEIALFATNLFDEKYQESHLDASLLTRAGLPPGLDNNLGIQGQRQRIGIRASLDF